MVKGKKSKALKSHNFGTYTDEEGQEKVLALKGSSKSKIIENINKINKAFKYRLHIKAVKNPKPYTLYGTKKLFESKIRILKDQDKPNMELMAWYMTRLDNINQQIKAIPLGDDVKVIEEEETLIKSLDDYHHNAIGELMEKVNYHKKMVKSLDTRRELLNEKRHAIASLEFEKLKKNHLAEYNNYFEVWAADMGFTKIDGKYPDPVLKAYKSSNPFKELQPPKIKSVGAKKSQTIKTQDKSGGKPKKCETITDGERCGARVLLKDENHAWGKWGRCKCRATGETGNLCKRHEKKNEEGLYGDKTLPKKYVPKVSIDGKPPAKPCDWWKYITETGPNAHENRLEWGL